MRSTTLPGQQQSPGLLHLDLFESPSGQKEKPHQNGWRWSCSSQIGRLSHPYRMRPATNGFSHGLKIARPLSIFAPVCELVPPFRIPIRAKRKATPNGVAFFLAEDEGFEPPQTESESGVLPLHKSSIARDNMDIIQPFFKMSSTFLKFCIFSSLWQDLPKRQSLCIRFFPREGFSLKHMIFDIGKGFCLALFLQHGQ